MTEQSVRSRLVFLAFCCVALTTSSCRQRTAAAAPPAANSDSSRSAGLILDQVNSSEWRNAWTNLVNDARQSFTPLFPKLVGVEVQLLLANPGPDEDRLTLAVLDASGRTVGEMTKTVRATSVDRVLFLFPAGGVNVAPGQLYELRLTGGTTFGWKYVINGYEHGSATFNGRPLVAGARSTFLFRTFGAS